jgi:hypothetical protein
MELAVDRIQWQAGRRQVVVLAVLKPSGSVTRKPTLLPHAKKQANIECRFIRGCIQKFPDWPPEVGTANSKALCH